MVQVTIPPSLLAREVPPLPVAVAAGLELEVEVASATFTPNVVPVITLVEPLLVVVVVNVTVAVVVAEQAVHDVHGAFEFQSPDVQPVQVDPGQPSAFHQFVHAPDVQDPEEPNGPQPPPNGPIPGPQGPLLPVHALFVVHDGFAVTANVASGAAVMECPELTQSCAMFLYIAEAEVSG